jgi:hypothetical protein
MKKMYVLLLVAVGFLGTGAIAQNDQTEVESGAKMEFESETHDYGTIEYQSEPYCTFEFTNTGNTPLIISKAEGSCGCTVPTWPKEPIAPGQTASIRVKYDTKRVGNFSKSVKIYSNDMNDPVKIIKIQGVVKAKPTSGAPVNSGGPKSN